MTRFGVGLASVLLCAVLAAPVGAQAAGNGLYSPFPTVGARKRAEHFINQLRANRVSRAELDHGAFEGGALKPVPIGAASARAIDPGGSATWLVWAALGGLLAACAIPVLRRE